MTLKSKKNKKQIRSVASKTTKKVPSIYNATSIEDIGLNKVQAKTISTLYTKEKAGVLSISKITGLPRRKVMKTLELQKLKTFSPGSYK